MFSQRIGITPSEKLVQLRSIDDDLRNTLWSLLTAYYWDKFNRHKYSEFGERGDHISGSNLGGLFTSLWVHYFKKPIDTIPEHFYDSGGGLKTLRDFYFKADWYQVYDLVELVAKFGLKEIKKEFIETCNSFLEKENAAYRFVDGQLVEISSSEEVSEVESAIKNVTPYAGAKEHLRQALQLLSDRETPDYRNSIKESISAVEALCRQIEGNSQAKLSSALKALEKKGVLHPALKSAFSSLYGYSSDSDGIRHALLEESTLTSADARFMLVSCSAFINYVIDSVKNAV